MHRADCQHQLSFLSVSVTVTDMQIYQVSRIQCETHAVGCPEHDVCL